MNSQIELLLFNLFLAGPQIISISQIETVTFCSNAPASPYRRNWSMNRLGKKKQSLYSRKKFSRKQKSRGGFLVSKDSFSRGKLTSKPADKDNKKAVTIGRNGDLYRLVLAGIS